MAFPRRLFAKHSPRSIVSLFRCEASSRAMDERVGSTCDRFDLSRLTPSAGTTNAHTNGSLSDRITPAPICLPQSPLSPQSSVSVYPTKLATIRLHGDNYLSPDGDKFLSQDGDKTQIADLSRTNRDKYLSPRGDKCTAPTV
jgi:hypothetical protein